MTSNPKVTINLAVYNGAKYLQHCLDSVLAQTYPRESLEINILDNASTDSTAEIVQNLESGTSNLGFAKFSFVKSKENLGMWPAQEKLLELSGGTYVVVLSVDVLIDPDFIKNAVEVMNHNKDAGALQAKIYRYELVDPETIRQSKIIDTLGFKIFRSRRIVNIGHGENDAGQYSNPKEIFAVEGAVPLFRKQALEDCRLISQNNKIVDPDFFWYGDDLDLAWRMRLFGWKQIYAPAVIAWHDRKTTKSLAGSWREFIKIRKSIPVFKRRLDWRNTTLAIIKNDISSDIFRDLPRILWRKLRLWTYFIIFEPSMLLEIFGVAKMLPRVLKRRGEIMKKKRISSREMRKWFS